VKREARNRKHSLDHKTESCGGTDSENTSPEFPCDSHGGSGGFRSARRSCGSNGGRSRRGGCAGGGRAGGCWGSVLGRIECSAVCLLGIVARALGSRIVGVVCNALYVSLLAQKGWDGVDVVRKTGSSAVTAGTVDDESVLRRIISICSKSTDSVSGAWGWRTNRVTVILQITLATEFRACGLLSIAPLAYSVLVNLFICGCAAQIDRQRQTDPSW
jgi:hypothetical protein